VDLLNINLLKTFDSKVQLSSISLTLKHFHAYSIIADTYDSALILEDDAVLEVKVEVLIKMLEDMKENDLDLIQVGFLTLNVFDGISIASRNLYNFFVRNTIFVNIFRMFGLREAERSKKQFWRKKIPSKYVVNDIRYGGHAYFISPRFASAVLELNSPSFLSLDDFFVSLSKMKSFRMVRLKHSRARQLGNLSSFSGSKRFGLDE
jgi:GR25 family glycosyltransferase involved in LPS biosynthesis